MMSNMYGGEGVSMAGFLEFHYLLVVATKELLKVQFLITISFFFEWE